MKATGTEAHSAMPSVKLRNAVALLAVIGERAGLTTKEDRDMLHRLFEEGAIWKLEMEFALRALQMDRTEFLVAVALFAAEPSMLHGKELRTCVGARESKVSQAVQQLIACNVVRAQWQQEQIGNARFGLTDHGRRIAASSIYEILTAALITAQQTSQVQPRGTGQQPANR